MPPSIILVIIHTIYYCSFRLNRRSQQNLKRNHLQEQVPVQNAGDTTLKQATISSKRFYYPYKLRYGCYWGPIVTASGFVHDGDSVV